MAEEKQITGENIIHAINFFKQKRGSDGLNEIIPELDFDPDKVLEEKWYPIDMYTKLLKVLEEKIEYKDYSISFRIGFDRSTKMGIVENEIGKNDPFEVFGKIQEVWWRFNSFSRVELKKIDENHLNIYLCDNIKDEHYCEHMRGFFAGVIRELCKQNGTKVKKVSCISNGGKYCKFEATWDKPPLVIE
jgi:predicted hydrocarbon binding protein